MILQKIEHKPFNCTIETVTLLSIEEYEKYEKAIPATTDAWWWLRTSRKCLPVRYQDPYPGVAYATKKGVMDYGYAVNRDHMNVRPALYISIDNPAAFKPTDKIVLKGHKKERNWTVLDVFEDKILVLCDNVVAARRFDPKSTDWETSELKGWLEDWLLKFRTENEC